MHGVNFSNSNTSSPPEKRGWPGLAEWVLRICFAVRCLALGDAFLWNPWERDSEIFALLLFDWQWPETTALRLDNGGILIVVLAGLVAVAGPFVRRALGDGKWTRAWEKCELALLLFSFFWELAIALAMTFRGGKFYSQLTIPSHTLRMAMPLTLVLGHFDVRKSAGALSRSIVNVLRVCIVVTFLAHGWKAWQLSPEYTTLVLGGWQNTFGTNLSQSTAESMLRWIGALDLVFAAGLVVGRWRLLFLYLVLWGAASALGRTIGGGGLHYPETFLRVAHAGGPLALFLEWRRQSSQLQQPSTGPE
jgi:hypothetical protein